MRNIHEFSKPKRRCTLHLCIPDNLRPAPPYRPSEMSMDSFARPMVVSTVLAICPGVRPASASWSR